MTKTVQQKKGFTLVELLVVIAIIAILAAVVVLIINPIELTKRGRDATRLSDLANLQSAINVAVQEGKDFTALKTELCNGAAAGCSGNSNDAGDTRKVDGTGWVKVNLAAQKTVTVPTLPADPLNTADNHYSYKVSADGTGYEIDAVLESAQQSDKMTTDGGNDDNFYEVGSDLTVFAP
jgi:prepilin-type N-terminal cleavage/methylation domain-containing protein